MFSICRIVHPRRKLNAPAAMRHNLERTTVGVSPKCQAPGEAMANDKNVEESDWVLLLFTLRVTSNVFHSSAAFIDHCVASFIFPSFIAPSEAAS